jgi:hypothetical protein
MSLDAMFAALKLDDASTIVDAVKKDGVEKSGLASNIEVLRAKCASKEDAEAIAGMKTVTKLAAECPEAQAFTKECLLACKSLSWQPVIVFKACNRPLRVVKEEVTAIWRFMRLFNSANFVCKKEFTMNLRCMPSNLNILTFKLSLPDRF